MLTTLVIVCFVAFACEWVDGAIGMGYGTILSPTLVIMGFPVLEVVPAILITQAFGGICAGGFHHLFSNASFILKGGKPSDDLKTVFWITSLGMIASAFASFVAVNVISKTALSIYIGAMVALMGILLLLGFTFKYSNSRMVLVGFVSALNKGLSGGGYGPLVTGGQMVLGNEYKSSVACTTLAEPPICIAGFIAYAVFNGVNNWRLILALGIGAILAGPLGAYTTKVLNGKRLKKIVAVLLVVLGTLSLLKACGLIHAPISL